MKMDNCYSGRIPRERIHSQDERLTNKHVQTLSFLQDIAKENKQLKERVEELEGEREKCRELHFLAEESQARIQEMQEQYLKRTDEINQTLTEKHRVEAPSQQTHDAAPTRFPVVNDEETSVLHRTLVSSSFTTGKRMIQVLEDKLDMERNLKEEILKLRHEIESLQRTNAELRQEHRTEDLEKMKETISWLESRLNDAELEIAELNALRDCLQSQVTEAQTSQVSTMHQLQDLRSQNHLLDNKLREASQKNLELVHKVDQLQREAQDDSMEKEHTKLVEAMRNKMEKLVKEKEIALLRESEMFLHHQEDIASVEAIRLQVAELEREKAEVFLKCEQLTAEVEQLRKTLQREEDKASFRDFVSMKRALISVRKENEILWQKMQKSSSTLPLLKEDLPSVKQAIPLTKKGKKKMLAITLGQGSEKACVD